ncbi:hypothetical protein OG417_27200 [Actinoallomurus sp. NBC_01490]|jgi:hypothetical protein|uniref:hypothetical protein n=1 Tax=Actinoallomurus sp. NBC_01490 TaxID=2903557 RepID=UPI002E303B55|nr:hypothetical protein [Actinoallomurus sp. NBC_01490]
MTIRACPGAPLTAARDAARAADAVRSAAAPPMTDERSVRDRWHGAAGPILVQERALAGAAVDVAEETP